MRRPSSATYPVVPSPEREALLAAVRANRDDDQPRLAFADWLEAHGEADFATFIRREIERDRLPQHDPRREQLHKQTIALRRALPLNLSGISSPTRRGFHCDILAGLFALRAGLDRLGPYAPRLKVLLSGNTAEEEAAKEEAANGGPDRLGAAWREVFASPWVRQWEQLEIQFLPLSADWVRWMTGPGNLTGLRLLCLSWGPYPDDVVRALTEADPDASLPSLKDLEIQEVPMVREEAQLTPAAVGAIVESPLLARLEHLALVGRWVTDEGLRALARSPRLTGLRSLALGNAQTSAVGLRAILESPHLARLSQLNLLRLPVDPENAARLARPDVLPGLTRLGILLAKTPNRKARIAALRRRLGDGLILDEEDAS
jgi:uncharacterized protein (TIGR02996 family)